MILNVAAVDFAASTRTMLGRDGAAWTIKDTFDKFHGELPFYQAVSH